MTSTRASSTNPVTHRRTGRSIRRPPIVLLLLAACSAAPLEPQVPVARVLFIGNSLTAEHDLPGMVQAFARSVKNPGFEVQAVVRPGWSLEEHWNDGTALELIDRGGWDVVVLQQGPSALPESRELLISWTERFNARIRGSGARTALYMVWPAASRSGDLDRVIDSYRLAAEAVDGLLIPAGAAWREAWRGDASLALYGPDGFHPSPAGTYLAAVVATSVLLQQSPQGWPSTVATSGGTVTIDPADATVLQSAAAAVVSIGR